MDQPEIKNKYCQLIWDGQNLSIPNGWKPRDDQLCGSDLDRLAEIASRVCYDSCGTGRSSENLHKHLAEVGHGSVYEHCNLTIQIPINHIKLGSHWFNILKAIMNRPGVYLEIVPQNTAFRITCNFRAVFEWDKIPNQNDYARWLGHMLMSRFKIWMGLSSNPYGFSSDYNYDYDDIIVTKPISEDEIWCSIFIKNVSRGFSHELVRHKFRTAVSQRSTRYVNENESDWCWHPLLYAMQDDFGPHDIGNYTHLIELEEESKKSYQLIVKDLEEYLVKKGVDKFTARKQSRGAARGFLGNALSTELLFSASLAQWKHMLRMRASEAADAEIRLVFNEVFNILKNRWPEYFKYWVTKSCSDGMGFYIITS